MATTTYKILGQSAPASTSNADLITVGASKSQIVSTLNVANTTTSDATCRVFARIAGAAAATTNAIVYDATVPANGFLSLTLGITLAATDVVTVRTGTSNALTFTAFGTELA
jgi:hypothetical protein